MAIKCVKCGNIPTDENGKNKGKPAATATPCDECGGQEWAEE